MAAQKLEQRVAALEEELSRLKKIVDGKATPWWEKWAGAFANDPYFEQAMKFAQEYREASRTKQRNRRGKSHGDS